MLFQVYADDTEAAKKKRGDHPDEHTPFGVKVAHGKEIDLLNMEEHFAQTVASVEPTLTKEGVAEFMGTLTPGAQNAIHAACFVWGYENAARSLKSAMKLDEVKNAADTEEKSKAVIESMQKQLEPSGHESATQATTYVWGFYNEDMKEAQAMSAKSESISQRDKVEDKEREKMQVPATSQEAVGLSVVQNSANPALVYCASAQAEAERQRQAVVVEVKREELAELEDVKLGRRVISTPEDAVAVALERKKDVEEEYLRIEKELMAAVSKVDALSRDDPKNVERIANMLPSELRRSLLAKEKRFVRRVAMRRQLTRWLSAARSCRKSVSGLPLDKLKRLVKLSSLFG